MIQALAKDVENYQNEFENWVIDINVEKSRLTEQVKEN